MNLLNLTEELVLSIVKNKDAVKVEEAISDESNIISINILVDNDDMPRVVGKSGRVINSIRTIVQTSSNLNDSRIVKINVNNV